MEELEVTFERAARIWWALAWRTALLSMFMGALVGFVAGFVLIMFGLKQSNGLVFLLGGTVGVVVGIWMTKKILKKKYPGFRIALIRDEDFVR